MTAFIKELSRLPIQYGVTITFFLTFNRISLSDFYPVWLRYMEVTE